MKATVKYADGKVVELEGSQEELAATLGALVGYGQSWFINQPISVPSVWLNVPNTCQHEYSSPWNGTVPPNCKKCGEPAYFTYTYSGVTAHG